MSLEYFQRYLQNMMFSPNKVLGSDGNMNALGGHYVMVLNIQDPQTNIGYEYVTYIIIRIHDDIFVAQEGRLENLKFHHYSLLMHLILYTNVQFIDQIFFSKVQRNGERYCLCNDGKGYGKDSTLTQTLFIFIMILYTIFSTCQGL